MAAREAQQNEQLEGARHRRAVLVLLQVGADAPLPTSPRWGEDSGSRLHWGWGGEEVLPP